MKSFEKNLSNPQLCQYVKNKNNNTFIDVSN